jgi:hypothetical protein
MSDVAVNRVDQHEHDYSEEEYMHAKSIELPVLIAKVDCVDHKDLCQKENIRAYPTLLLFVNGERWPEGGYRGSRTVVAMTDWLRQVEDAHKEEMEHAPRVIQSAHQRTCLFFFSLFWLWLMLYYSSRWTFVQFTHSF